MTLEDFFELQKDDVREFINHHSLEDPHYISLKFSGNKTLPLRAIAEQINCIQKAKYKLPGVSGKDLIYDSLAFEQCSGEIAAGFKSQLIKGKRIIDLTGGLGIDTIFLSNQFEEVIYCEKNPVLSKIFEYNSSQLNLKNIIIRNGDSIETLRTFPDNYFDWIYIDPSRRKEQKRTLRIENYEPNILDYIGLFHAKAGSILVKLSPAEEIKEVIKKIPEASLIYVISVDGECKELLAILTRKESRKEIKINAVVLNSNWKGNFILEGESDERFIKGISDVKDYFYVPDAAIIKSRLSSRLAESSKLSFVNSSVDYLTSEQLIHHFPGRIFKVKNSFLYNKKWLRQYLKNNKITSANIARRDFPDSPEKIKSNYNLRDGGNDYLFFTKNAAGDFMIIHCVKHEFRNGDENEKL